MTIKKCLVLFVVLALSFTAFAADEWDGGFESASFDSSSDFSDDFSSDFGSFDDFGSSSDEPKVQIGAVIDADFRYYLNDEDNPIKALPKAKVSFTYDAEKAGAKLVFDINQDKWENSKIDLIDELVLSAYLGNLQIDAGKMRIVWGKGDKLHVLDNFNADSYVNFLVPDYIERRISIPMIRAAYSVPSNSNIVVEGVYAPFTVKNRYNNSGMFVPYQVSNLTDTLMGGSPLAPYSERIQEILADLESDSVSKILYPNLNKLKYGQYGIRMTGTLGKWDLGASYYNGWFKDPSFNAEKFGVWKDGHYLSKPDFLNFDHKQTFGLEAATTVWHFNLRGEAAFNLTEDENGKNPWMHNNSVSYVAGFDIDLPIWNMNVNIQDIGSVILNGNESDKNTKALRANNSGSSIKDVDYNSHGYTENMIVANVSASFAHDKLKPEITGIWCIEKQDFVLMPKISYDLTPNLNVNLLMMHIYSHDDESKFYGFHTGDLVQLGARYQF